MARTQSIYRIKSQFGVVVAERLTQHISHALMDRTSDATKKKSRSRAFTRSATRLETKIVQLRYVTEPESHFHVNIYSVFKTTFAVHKTPETLIFSCNKFDNLLI